MTLGDSQADSHGAPAVGALAHIASEDRHSGTLQPGIKLTCTTEQTEIDHWCTCRLSRYHGPARGLWTNSGSFAVKGVLNR